MERSLAQNELRNIQMNNSRAQMSEKNFKGQQQYEQQLYMQAAYRGGGGYGGSQGKTDQSRFLGTQFPQKVGQEISQNDMGNNWYTDPRQQFQQEQLQQQQQPVFGSNRFPFGGKTGNPIPLGKNLENQNPYNFK